MVPLLRSTALLAGIFLAAPAEASHEPIEVQGFVVQHELRLPGTPVEIFDAMTGDISGWWDHSFSDEPKALYIEPRPGGGFYEIFDDEGNGIRHAVVDFVARGRRLRFTGPLGLGGNAVYMTHDITFTADEESHTVVRVTISAVGAVRDGWAAAVDRVWHHFLFDQLAPWVGAGKHLKR